MRFAWLQGCRSRLLEYHCVGNAPLIDLQRIWLTCETNKRCPRDWTQTGVCHRFSSKAVMGHVLFPGWGHFQKFYSASTSNSNLFQHIIASTCILGYCSGMKKALICFPVPFIIFNDLQIKASTWIYVRERINEVYIKCLKDLYILQCVHESNHTQNKGTWRRLKSLCVIFENNYF